MADEAPAEVPTDDPAEGGDAPTEAIEPKAASKWAKAKSLTKMSTRLKLGAKALAAEEAAAAGGGGDAAPAAPAEPPKALLPGSKWAKAKEVKTMVNATMGMKKKTSKPPTPAGSIPPSEAGDVPKYPGTQWLKAKAKVDAIAAVAGDQPIAPSAAKLSGLAKMKAGLATAETRGRRIKSSRT